MGKSLPTGDPYGESWELHDTSTIANGMHAGRTLGDLLAEFGTDLIGAGNNPEEGFPLLAKILDASDWLSVQVHPDDEQAHKLEGDPRGKTEAWYIIAAESGAQLVIGVQPGTERSEMAQAIRENRLENLLVYADVRAGDVLYIPANTIHAIGPGLLIYEIQQSSDVTYRLYDWGRMGMDGKPRPLHVEKGVEVSNVETVPQIEHPDEDATMWRVIDGKYFKTVLDNLSKVKQSSLFVYPVGRFHALTCIEGTVNVEAGGVEVTMQTGQTALVPACSAKYKLSGSGRVLRSWQSG